jgi:hypothetical protein
MAGLKAALTSKVGFLVVRVRSDLDLDLKIEPFGHATPREVGFLIF